MGSHLVAVGFKKPAAFRFGLWSHLPKPRIAEHFPKWHAGCLEAAEKFDPCQDGGIIVSLARRIAMGARQEANALVITKRMGRKSGPLRQFSNPHASPVVSTACVIRVRVRSKSSDYFCVARAGEGHCLEVFGRDRSQASIHSGT